MNKILFIPGLDKNHKYGGGAICSIRNYECLKKCGEVILSEMEMEKKSFLKKVFNFFTSSIPLCTGKKGERTILNEIKKSKCDIVFINNSFFGGIIPKIKKYKVRVITFFHNVEITYLKEVEKISLKNRLKANAVMKSEKKCLKYSDAVIFLNERDKKEASRLYAKYFCADKAHIIPATFQDDFSIQDKEYILFQKKNGIKNALFFGSSFAPNYNGIRWFIRNVLDKISCNLKIVGVGFDKYKDELSGDRTEILGAVPDMKQYILDSDFIVMPIFEGSGMKIKTAEALMYGKTIFGSNEAFEGYDLDFEKVGGLCNTADEFIEKINKKIADHNISVFNEYSRDIYEKNFSNQIAVNIFNKILDKAVQ